MAENMQAMMQAELSAAPPDRSRRLSPEAAPSRGAATVSVVSLCALALSRDVFEVRPRSRKPTAAYTRSAIAVDWRLTGRELEVLSLVADGLSNAMVAQRLVISEHTVHRHIANIFVKLGVSTRAAAVAVAAERDLLG